MTDDVLQELTVNLQSGEMEVVEAALEQTMEAPDPLRRELIEPLAAVVDDYMEYRRLRWQTVDGRWVPTDVKRSHDAACRAIAALGRCGKEAEGVAYVLVRACTWPELEQAAIQALKDIHG